MTDEEQDERDFIEYSARLSLHEFLLEIVFASDFVFHADPQGDFARFRDRTLDLIRFKAGVSDTGALADGPADLSLQIQGETIRLAEKFFDKTSERLTSILKQRESIIDQFRKQSQNN